MATVSATISGSPLRGFQNFNFEIELGLGKRAKRATCQAIYDTEDYAGAKAESGQVLRISIDGSEVFEGPIQVVTDKWINPTAYQVSIDATDWTPFLDAHLIHTREGELSDAEIADGGIEDDSLPEQTLSGRVNWILTTFCEGFTLGTIENNETVKAQAIDHRPASVVFDELAELTNQVFDLSFDKEVTFTQTGDAAPIGAIDVDSDLTISDVEVTEDWSDLHNVFLIKDFEVRSAWSWEEEFTADGRQKFYTLTAPPWSVSETIVSVKHEGSWSEKTSVKDPIGDQRQYEMYRGELDEEPADEEINREMKLEEDRQKIIDGEEGEVYICLWNEGIRFPKVDLPKDGDVIRVRYPFRRPQQTLWVEDTTSIEEIAEREGTDGIHQKVINVPELRAVSLESAVDWATLLLERGAWPILTGSFHTYVTGWEPRQKFTIYSDVRDIDDPRNDGDPAPVWVSRVIMSASGVKEDGSTLVDHTVEFTSRPYAVPVPLDEMLWKLIDKGSSLRPPGTAPEGGTDYTTSTSTSTTTTLTSTSTTQTATSTSTSTSIWPGLIPAQVMFSVPGTLSVSTDQAPWYICSIEDGVTILDTALTVKTAPAGAAIEVDVQVSRDCGSTWNTIYATRPTISAGSKGCSSTGTLATEGIPDLETYVLQDEILRVDVTQVGSSTAGADLTVSLRVRQGVGTTTSQTSTSTSTTISGTSTSTTTTLMSWQSPVAVYSSCGEFADLTDDNFVDGDTGTAWAHLVDEDHEIVVDLGETKYAEAAKLYVYPDQDQSLWDYCLIYMSDDPTSWGSIIDAATFTKSYGAGWVVHNFASTGTGRYLRIADISTEDSLDHVMGAEFEVYASG